MPVFEGISENFRFLVLEVKGQLEALRTFMRAPSREMFDRIKDREEYVDNLKTIIENKCFTRIHDDAALGSRDVDRLRAVNLISVGLERVADHCENILGQMKHLSDAGALNAREYAPLLDVILDALDRIVPALEQENLNEALAVCRAEYALDRAYKEIFDRIVDNMTRHPQNVPDDITSIFIYRYLERIGDSLLDVGEAVIFAILGERIKIEQFDALHKTLSSSGYEGPLSDVDYKGIWGSRSGCRIGAVGPGRGPRGCGSIYKEGPRRKILREKQNIERWSDLFPNLVPAVYGYREEEESASMLVEFLRGCTLDDIILSPGPDERSSDFENGDPAGARDARLDNVLFVLRQTLTEIWEKTLVPGPAPTDYVRQMRDRMESVRRVHPALWRPDLRIGTTDIPSTGAMLDACEALERSLPAPYTVFTHGDFNINNILFDHATQAVRFIDLHRSRDFDPVQDVSVFMVSNYRIPVFEPALRERLLRVMRDFFVFARDFAAAHGDAAFEARLALALARSFYTSTRFELKYEFAKEMFFLSHYFMERFLAHQGRPWETFRLPGAFWKPLPRSATQ